VGKIVFHWLGNLDVVLHGISVDFNVAMSVVDANNLSQAVPDRQLRSLEQVAEIEAEDFEFRSVPAQGVNYAF
jgi:hypothetical protein